jgi:cysteinyl-tRNA synthetase
MAEKYLGPAFELHGGGNDLRFPHHENELAQSRALGHEFARIWTHNGMLEFTGEKMAKSVGNVLSPRDLLRQRRGVVLRYALLGAHYRSPLEFSEEVLADAAASYDRLATFATNAARALALAGDVGPDGSDAGADGSASPREVGGWLDRFQAALDDDLNVPAALAVLFDLVAEANPLMVRLERGGDDAIGPLRDRFGTFLELAGRLGFAPLDDLPDPAAFRPLLDLLLDLRERARATRDFAAADAIRDRLAEAGIRVEDRPGGPRWHLLP